MEEEILSFAIQKLWDILSHEYEQFRGVKDQVTELKTDLNTLRSFLKDADTKKHTNERVRNCLDVIKEIIFDAEDTIETFVLKDELGKNAGIKKRIRRLACFFPERREIALEIGNISKRILKVISRMETFGVQRIIDDAKDPEASKQRPEFARKYESNLVGIEENVEKLVGYLVDEDDVHVVSITGMGGLGKTTLARQAFHHDMVKRKFDKLAWVCVSQVCDPVTVWKAILLNFTPKEKEKDIMEMGEARLQDEIFQLLETSNSIIVLDDVWKEEDWNLIKPIFPHKTGSKVLLTSRNERVTGGGEAYINFKPDCLSDEDSWTLFQKIALPNKVLRDKEMENMGKQMMEHCRGLPLAIRVLGALLASKYTLRDWKRLSENIGSHIVGKTIEENNTSLNYVLSLSFDELPGYLKYCFLYLAQFPEDHEVNVEHLSYYWAAEGITGYNDGETIRDVGDNYIEELVMRNMVISERDNTTSRFETCCLHDLMREVCLSKAKEENFLQIVGQSLNQSRRFVSHDPYKLHVERDISNVKVRSFVIFRTDKRRWNVSGLCFSRLQLLRVLHLPGAIFEGQKLPSSIGKLIHLRYLNLEGAEVFHLPSSLGNLKLLIYLNLEVYRWDSWDVTSVPNVFMGMKELRYLALPKSMIVKRKLELSNLVNLETLINFTTRKINLEDLHGMERLRTLSIFLEGEKSLESLSASIGRLRHLENLVVYCQEVKETREWRTLLEFNSLQNLKLSVGGTLLSDGLQFPSRLTSISLYESGLEEDPMPVLEKLGLLKKVNLLSKCFSGRRMVCSRGGFPQLHKLVLWGLEELEEWIIERGSMPLLRSLIIWNCEKLKEIPDGLRFITSLENLLIDEECKKRVSEGGEDYYKVQHIPYVRFGWSQ